MASITLSESAKLSQDLLVAGVIETTITVDRFFELLPFDAIHGNSLKYNRENVLGDVQYTGVGDSITAVAAASFTEVTSSLTTIIGQAEVNQLVQSTRSDVGNDQTAIQIASKAKSAGRQYRSSLINGTGASDEFTGLLSLCASGQKVDTGANGAVLSFSILDNLLDLVVDKDGQVDYIQMPSRTLRAYFALLRALGGAGIGEVITLPSGAQVPGYRGTPIFRNDYIPVNQTKGASTGTTTILAGTLDDGSRSMGIAGLTAENDAGMAVEDVGIHQSKDERLYRVKWYCGLACFSQKGLAAAEGITN